MSTSASNAVAGLRLTHPYDSPSTWYATIEGVLWDPAVGLEAVLSVKHEIEFDQPKPNASSRARGKYKGEKPPVFTLKLRIWRAVGDTSTTPTSLQTVSNLIERIQAGSHANPVPIQVSHPLLSLFHVKQVAVTNMTGGEWKDGYLEFQVTLFDQSPAVPVAGVGGGLSVPAWQQNLATLQQQTSAYVAKINAQIKNLQQSALGPNTATNTGRISALRTLREQAIASYQSKVAQANASNTPQGATMSGALAGNNPTQTSPANNPPIFASQPPALSGLARGF